VHLTINDRDINIPPSVTILEAAQFHGIEIPTLCSHKDLTPWGACRICIVEVEGMRGFPTACTTPVTDGLVVRTQTPALLAQRNEILQLMMSQHPSTCLICGDIEKCRGGMETTRKAGVTVGCRTCPSDEQCEFQTLIQKMNISELTYFTHYRHLPVEKFDPFYDRDYNLCILCGRCVQVCNEVRLSHTLSFTERGHHIAIGPAFSRSHMDSGCEFCGACINVCPTGTLTEKVNKWVGNPDQKIYSTCAFCGIGCGLNLLVKDNQVIGSLPEFGDPVSAGQLCVKGRFCIPEMVTSYQRLKKPLIISGKTSQKRLTLLQKSSLPAHLIIL
jgi:predicted molibdopterin-dependent oxidoreductase YjgC